MWRTGQNATDLFILGVQVDNEVPVLGGCEHASCRLGHLMVGYREELANCATQHLQGSQRHDQPLVYNLAAKCVNICRNMGRHGISPCQKPIHTAGLTRTP